MSDLESLSRSELIALVEQQRGTIEALHATLEQQAADFERAQTGSRWRRRQPGAHPLYTGLGERVEKLLRLAQEEADGLRRASEQAAAELIAEATREAERIRAAAADGNGA